MPTSGHTSPGDGPANVVAQSPIAVASLPAAPAAMPDTQIAEIVLPDGTWLRVCAAIEAASLRRLLGVLRG